MPDGEDATDSQLWDRARDGEADAFGAIFERHDREVYNHVFRRTADWSVAEEVTSLVFLEAWRRRESVRLLRESSLPWLMGIANNVLLNRWRSKRRHRRALERLTSPVSEDFAEESDTRIDDVRRLERVLELVNQLSDDQREVLELVAWDGFDYEQASLASGVPVGTVKSRLARARKRLVELDAPVARLMTPDPDASHPMPLRPSSEQVIP